MLFIPSFLVVGMKTIDEVKKEILTFLDINNLNNLAIIADNDEDGLTAALQTKQFFVLKGVNAKVFFYDHSKKDSSVFTKQLFELNPDKLLFLDLNEGFVFDIITDLKLDFEFVVVDHHRGAELENIKQNHLIIKPTMFSEVESSKYPTSKMAHDLFEGTDWVCLIGLIGDFAFDKWEDFLNESIKKYDLTKEEFFYIANIVGCIISQYQDLIPELFEFLQTVKKPQDLVDSKFVGFKKEFDNIVLEEKEKFKTTAEKFEDIGLVIFETRKGFSSKFSTILSSLNSNTMFFIYSKDAEYIKGSLRRQDFKVDCNEVLKYCIKDVKDANGGGHIPAGGCKFPVTYLDEFKKRLVEFMKMQNTN